MKTKSISVTPTISAGAYTANDNVGGLMKFKDPAIVKGETVIIHGASLGDAAKQSVNTDLVIFREKPASTFTDNAEQVISDADLPLILHVLNFTSYDAFSANSSAQINDIKITVPVTSDGIYAALVTRGTPTYVATSDLDIVLTVEYED